MSEPLPRLRVLCRPGFRAENPYTNMLYTELTALGAEVSDYDPLRAALGRYDIVHVHWPESTFNASLPEALVTTRSLLFCIDALRRRGTKLVWTAHNLRAHEQRFPRAEAAFWRAFSKRVDAVIALSQSGLEAVHARSPELRARPGFVVPHPHYRHVYPDGVTRSQARARLALPQDAAVVLFFGRVVGYKNIPKLIELVRALPRLPDGREVVLLVAGKPSGHALTQALYAARGKESRVRFALRHIELNEAQHYFRAADLVVLPYKELQNSGAALLALGFDRPVLMPRQGAAIDLAQKLGAWIESYDQLDARALEIALLRASRLAPVTDGRHLRHLEPALVARATLSAFESLTRPALEPARARALPATALP